MSPGCQTALSAVLGVDVGLRQQVGPPAAVDARDDRVGLEHGASLAG